MTYTPNEALSSDASKSKGIAGNASSVGVRLTGGELAKASQLGDEYWLYVVENCFDGEGRLYGCMAEPRRNVP